jgi:glycosyltransferase involved in cell wall biosynthesis
MINRSPSISVIVPAKNEERRIGLCLEALAAQSYARESFDVIVVDNGSEDRTVAISQGFNEKLRLRILSSQHGTISALRNAGVNLSSGELLAFLDADCIPYPDWLQKAAHILCSDSSGIIGAHYSVPDDSTWVGKTWNTYQEACKIGDVSHVPAGDLLIPRTTFLSIGGFDETIQTNEDAELCERARAKGFSVRAHKELRVVHLGTAQTLKGFYRKQRWHGSHVFGVFLRELPRLRNVKAVAFAVYFGLWSLALLASIVFAVASGGWMLPLFPVAAILSLPIGMAIFFIARQRSRWADIWPLAILYLTYGFARAACLFHWPKKMSAGVTPTPSVPANR